MPESPLPEDAEPAAAGAAPGERVRSVLPAGAAKAVGDVVYQFRVALSNVKLYSAGSSQALKTVSAMYDPLVKTLEEDETLTFSDGGDVLVVNGAELRLDGVARNAAEFLASLLRRMGVKSVTFRLGLSLEELYKFLDAIASRRLDRDGSETLDQAVLAKGGVTHVTLNERVYVSLTEHDIVLEGLGAKLGGSSGVLDEVMRLADRIMDMTEVKDPSSRDQIRLEVAKQILKNNPGGLAKIAGEAPPALEPAAPAGEAAVSREALREVVTQTARTYRELAGAVDRAGPAGRMVGELKKLLMRLISLSGGPQDLAGLYEDLLEGGRADAAARAPGGSAAEGAPPAGPGGFADRLLGQDSLALREEDVRGKLPELIVALDLDQKPELAERILDRFAENLSSATAAARQKAVAGLSELLAAARRASHPGLADRLDPVLLEAGRGETDPQAYQGLAGVLGDRAGDLVRRGDYDRSGEILGLLRKHRNAADTPFGERPRLATAALDSVSNGGLMDLLIADLLSGNLARQERARELAIKLEDLGVAALVAEIKSNEDARARRHLASVAVSMGPSAVSRLLEALDSENSVNGIVHLMDAALDAGMPDFAAEKLRRLASHRDPQVRRKLIGVLRRLGTEKAAEVLLPLVKDEVLELRLAAVAAIGEMRHKAVAAPLAALLMRSGVLQGELDVDLQCAICASLGLIGDESAVPRLLSILLGEGWLARLDPRPLPVRLSAVVALTKFLHRNDVSQALLLMLKADEPALRQAAESVLRMKTPA